MPHSFRYTIYTEPTDVRALEAAWKPLPRVLHYCDVESFPRGVHSTWRVESGNEMGPLSFESALNCSTWIKKWEKGWN